MGKKAFVDSQPDLEILANEVRCTHGSTVGRLDEQSIFYLMSRGLSRKKAEKVMIDGFVNQVVEKIKARLSKLIRTKIN